jgi:aryl carrier-like protein
MIAAVRLVLEECEDTESDVLDLAGNLMEYGFDNVVPMSYQEQLNKRGKGKLYSRV